ncbi:MAG: hypothetical protein GY913_33820 [Proteobacteria bacterium]|nr:hypothetical protein [Pseudomonadota bacterium]
MNQHYIRLNVDTVGALMSHLMIVADLTEGATTRGQRAATYDIEEGPLGELERSERRPLISEQLILIDWMSAHGVTLRNEDFARLPASV